MSTDDDVEGRLALSKILAIVRHRRAGRTADCLKALDTGGVSVVEVTTSTPQWQDLIAGAPSSMMVGAGTITTLSELKDAQSAGARFIVSPGFDPTLVAAALDVGMTPIPGVFTGSEVMAARAAGATILKLFPAAPAGAKYLEGLRGPFANEKFLPTGGVTPENTRGWLAAGAFAVALGSSLTGRSAPVTDEDVVEVTQRARDAIRIAAGATP